MQETAVLESDYIAPAVWSPDGTLLASGDIVWGIVSPQTSEITAFQTPTSAPTPTATPVDPDSPVARWEHLFSRPEDSSEMWWSSLTPITADWQGRIWVQPPWYEDTEFSVFDGQVWQDFSWIDAGIYPECYVKGPPLSDRHGTLWFSVRDGIVGYDGENWQMVDITTPGLAYENIERIGPISVDHAGDLWVTSTWRRASTDFGPGVHHYDGAQWTTYTFDNSALPDHGSIEDSVAFDSSDRAWVGTSEGLIVLKDGEEALYTTDNSELALDDIRRIYIDPLDRVWLSLSTVTDDDIGLQMFDGKKWTSFTQDDFKCPRPIVMAFNQEGTAWTGSCTGSLMSYEGQEWTTHFATRGNNNRSGVYSINSVAIDLKGRVWVKDSESLYRYDGETWTTIDEANSGATWDDPGSIYVDAGGDVWIVTPNRVSVFHDE
jgi:hypothetical protein